MQSEKIRKSVHKRSDLPCVNLGIAHERKNKSVGGGTGKVYRIAPNELAFPFHFSEGLED